MMEPLSYEDALAQEPEILETQKLTLTDGTNYWPALAYALIIGYRPLMLDLHLPPGDGPHPLVIYIHGGAWYLGTPKYNNRSLRSLNIEKNFLKAGYAIARISYRLSSEAKWPAQLHDCKSAVRYLRKKAVKFNLDQTRFAAMGESAGGHLACMLALVNNVQDLEGNVGEVGISSAVQAAINWYGPTDLARMRTDGSRIPLMGIVKGRPEDMLIGEKVEKLEEKLLKASPVTYVHPDAPPFLNQHGDNDRLVLTDHAVTLHRLLCDVGVHSELDIIKSADHCFWGNANQNIMKRVIDFLNEQI